MNRVRQAIAWGIVTSAATLSGCSNEGEDRSTSQNETVAPSIGLAVFPDKAMEEPAVSDLSMVSAVDSQEMKDNREVVGVVVDGRPRAYSLPRLSNVESHVLVDDQSATGLLVTFCDRTQCLRVFETGGRSAESFQMRGFGNNTMLIGIDGEVIEQTSDHFPLPAVEAIRTTWGEWKKLHPDTVVYE